MHVMNTTANLCIVALMLASVTTLMAQQEEQGQANSPEYQKWLQVMSCVACRTAFDINNPQSWPGDFVANSDAHCREIGKGVYKDRCHVVARAIANLSGKKKKPKDICQAIRACESKQVKAGQEAKLLSRPCKLGSCTIGHHVSNVVVEGSLPSQEVPKPGTKNGVQKIPRVVHFIFGLEKDFGGKPFSLIHYLALRSAHDRLPGYDIAVYYRYKPTTKAWKELVKLPRIRLIKVDPVTKVGKFQVQHVAHIADILRLQLLRDIGGIYMDSDVVTVKDFEPLLKHSFVMGQEGDAGVYGLCNAVMLSQSKSPFVLAWIRLYEEAYHPQIWSMHSVKLPSMLAANRPQDITVLGGGAFFKPLWDQLEYLFRGTGETWEENYAVHLWESLAWDQYIHKLTKKYIKNESNNFNDLVKDLLPPSPGGKKSLS